MCTLNYVVNSDTCALIFELVSKKLNHLAAILHIYAGGLHLLLLFLKKKTEILLHF